MNPHRGEVAIEVAGASRVLRYGWQEIAALQAALGDDFTAVLARAMAETNLRVVATALAIGLKGSWPDASADVIMASSPAINAVNDALNRALVLAFHGPKGVPDDPAPRPTLAARMLAAIRFRKPSVVH